ncbi:MAG: hypothetical protein QOG62_291 [Thermoleophilaceae bacterium]|jgi:HAMP domain-containing protein|nr:hypothetical protein [Thermoleophilaceae bacterium]
MRGAWTWPAFAVLMPADALVMHLLPPIQSGFDFIPALIVSSFGNLILVGAIAPWLAGRLTVRDRVGGGTTPREVFADKASVWLLLGGLAALIATGLGNREVVVTPTDRLERLTTAVEAYVTAHGPPEVQRNLQTANTTPLDAPGNFRVCVALDDRTRAWCMFVDAAKNPPVVTPDSDRRPNAVYFGEQ